jgi:hypothetical protein
MTNISDSAALQDHVGSEMPAAPDPGITCGIVDLGGIALDPSDPSDPSDNKTVWIFHAYSNHGNYTEVVGAVKH